MMNDEPLTALGFDFNHAVFHRASSFKEIAAFLRTDVSFVEREARRGKLKVRKFTPKMIRILPHDLIAWLESAARLPGKEKPPCECRESEPVAA